MLRSGEVVVVGGLRDTDVFDDGPGVLTQRYDPISGLWRLAAPTAGDRRHARANLLPDGRVLASGGVLGSSLGAGTGGSLSSAELYDPETDAWAPVTTMTRARGRHSSTLLADGRVLVTGGVANVDSAELFDLSTSLPPPSVLAVDPQAGPTAGGTTVTITGNGFGVVNGVDFGGTPAKAYVVQDDRTLLAVTPPRAVGPADVRVTTPAGTSGQGQQARFTYFPPSEVWLAVEEPAGIRHFSPTATILRGARCQRPAPAPDCEKVLLAGGENVLRGTPPAELYDPATGRWDETPGPNDPRSFHTATLLPSGDVLVTGGRPLSGNGELASAELYRPDRRAWEVLPPMATERSRHTATLLKTGEVLVVGGDDGSVEIFDPERRAWRRASGLKSGRNGHTATLLSDGRVLVAGGRVPGEKLATGARAAGEPTQSAEIYDPASETWSLTAEAMEFARTAHTATLLSGPACGSAGVCGKVLVAGGGPGTVGAELFDPSTGEWSTTAAPARARRNHTATVLPSGRVLVAGGAVGGDTRLASAEVYDPTSGEWSPTAPMLDARSGHSALLLTDGTVLAVSGTKEGKGAELYDESFGAPRPPVITAVDGPVAPSGPVSAPAVVTIHGRHFSSAPSVHIGGEQASVILGSDNRVEIAVPSGQPQGTVALAVTANLPGGLQLSSLPVAFTFASGRWRGTGSFATSGGAPAGRYLHTSTLLPVGAVLVAGGTTDFTPCPECMNRNGEGAPIGKPAVPLASAQIYDTGTGKWRAVAPMSVARFAHTATALPGGKVLVAGGQDANGVATAVAEVYDPSTGTWSVAPPMMAPRFSHSATALTDGRVLVAGGAAQERLRPEALASAEIYDPKTNTWAPVGPLGKERVNHTATLLGDGSVLAVGGLGPELDGINSAKALTSAERFDPVTRRWESVGSLNVARHGHSATLLSGAACARPAAAARCGDVLVAGGNAQGAQRLSAELYDPTSRQWVATGILRVPRGGLTATLLGDGKVLVTGSGPTFPGDEAPATTASSELYDPGSGEWSLTMPMATPRGGHTATDLGDGTVLVSGGYSTPPLDEEFATTAEIYTPAPTVLSAVPVAGPTQGGTAVTLTGVGLGTATAVRFGGFPASFTPKSPTELVATAPAHDAGRADVEVIGPGGTSATLERAQQVVFVYRGRPGEVTRLSANALSSTSIALSFNAADDGSGGFGLATRYVVKQADAEIRSDEEFARASGLCGGNCNVPPALAVSLEVKDLEPGRTYHYALRAVNDDGEVGPRSASVSATTAAVSTSVCPTLPTPGSAQVVYAGGRYHLAGAPAGTLLASGSPLYAWFDQGAGGGYSVLAPNEPLAHDGRGYWTWSACDRLVTLAAPGADAVSLPLEAYHASMVGNPSTTAPAVTTGHDFAARWDPSLNAGAGGYHISGYQQAQSLAVGEGAWVFSFVPTTIALNAASP